MEKQEIEHKSGEEESSYSSFNEPERQQSNYIQFLSSFLASQGHPTKEFQQPIQKFDFDNMKFVLKIKKKMKNKRIQTDKVEEKVKESGSEKLDEFGSTKVEITKTKKIRKREIGQNVDLTNPNGKVVKYRMAMQTCPCCRQYTKKHKCPHTTCQGGNPLFCIRRINRSAKDQYQRQRIKSKKLMRQKQLTKQKEQQKQQSKKEGKQEQKQQEKEQGKEQQKEQGKEQQNKLLKIKIEETNKQEQSKKE